RHQNICADPCATARTFVSETSKRFVNCGVRKKFSPIVRTASDEINGRSYEDRLESVETRGSLWSFGGHRPPLQFFAQTREQFLVNVVESAVAENGDNIFRLQHRRDSIDNRIRVLFVKRGPSVLGYCRNDRFGMQSLRLRDLFQLRDLGNENAVGQRERFG